MSQTIAYLRSFPLRADLQELQLALQAYAQEKNVGSLRFETEQVPGKIPWRNRTIAHVLEKLACNDCLLVEAFSCLGRSMLECLEILSVAASKGIRVYVVKGDWQIFPHDSPLGIADLFSLACEMERELLSFRSRQSLQALKEAGMPLGRPKGSGKSKLDVHKREIKALLANGSTQKFIAKRYGTTQANLHNWIKKHGLENKPSPLPKHPINPANS